MVLFELAYYDASISNNQINLGGILSKEYVKWDIQQRVPTELGTSNHGVTETTISASTLCPDWSGKPQNFYAGFYYEHSNFDGLAFAPLWWHATWDLGISYIYITDLSVFDFENMMSSCFGDFDSKTQVCGNIAYRRFIYTKRMFLFKGTGDSGGYSIFDWELNTSIHPFTIRVAYPYFPYTWHKDFSISANNINNNIESVILVVETFEKIY